MKNNVSKMFLDKKENQPESLLQKMKRETPIEVSEEVDRRTRLEAKKVMDIVEANWERQIYSWVEIKDLKIWLSIDNFKNGFEEIETRLRYLRELTEKKLNENLSQKEYNHYRERYDLFDLNDQLAGMVWSRRKQVFDWKLKEDWTEPIIWAN